MIYFFHSLSNHCGISGDVPVSALVIPLGLCRKSLTVCKVMTQNLQK